MTYYDLHVRLNDTDPQDQVIIGHLNSLGSRGKAPWVRRVLWEAITGPTPTDIHESILVIQEAVESLQGVAGVVKKDESERTREEPEAAARNLDDLISRLEVWDTT